MTLFGLLAYGIKLYIFAISECGCNEGGVQVNECDQSGQCYCQPNFSGMLCDRCAAGYYRYPDCLACNCDIYGSYGIGCDEIGQCTCRQTFEGLTCNKCRPNYYNYPICEGREYAILWLVFK